MLNRNLNPILCDLNNAIQTVLRYQKDNEELKKLYFQIGNFRLEDQDKKNQSLLNLFISIKLFLNNSLDFFNTYSEEKYNTSFQLYEFMKELLLTASHSNEKEIYQQISVSVLELENNKDFEKDYKNYALLKKLNQLLLHNEEFIQNLSLSYNLSHDILFLQKGYVFEQSQLGERTYTNIEYYKALDADSLRKNDNSIDGSWLYISKGPLSYDDSIPIEGTYYNWSTLKSEHKVFNKNLKEEIEAISFSSSKEKIEKLLKNRIIIVSNCFLNYETIMKEYYAHFGMDPKKFAEYIYMKYDCDIICPNIQTQSTYLTQYRKLN